jgi:hypothetical protein
VDVESGENVPPSLIFGGYDEARFDNTSTITIAMDPDVSKSLSVHVSGISYFADKNWGALGLSPQDPITAVIDSSVPHIWLPLDICQAFETSFGLKWDPKSELYLVNESDYVSLLSRNITIAIDIGSPSSSIQPTTIQFPFASLILNASSPLVSPSSRYFALKRAASSQYTLGRAFLQQAYITANYNKQAFNISRAVYTGKSLVFVILSEPTSTAPGNSIPATNTRKGTWSSGAIAGITTALFFVAFVIFFFTAWRVRLWPFRKKLLAVQTYPDDIFKAEMDGEGKPIVEVDSVDLEFAEAPADVVKWELEGPDRIPVELWGEQLKEIEGPDRPPVEMLGVVPRYELSADG